jgi:hypothetical protein
MKTIVENIAIGFFVTLPIALAWAFYVRRRRGGA